MTIALIDGDEAVFKACCKQGSELDWDTGDSVDRPPTFAEARANLDQMIEDWTEAAGCDSHVVVLSPDDRKLFRRGVFPAYKAGRSEKPEHFWSLVEYLRAEYDCDDEDGLEADDVMGIRSNAQTVICSSDKDMKTIPGRLYNPGKDTFTVITPVRADWQWMYQTLTGDSTDGFSGCWKVGPKGAEDLLEQGTSMAAWWPLVVEAFEEATLPDPTGPKGKKARRLPAHPKPRAEAIQQAVLARILRPGDFDAGRIRYSIGDHTVDLDARAISR